MASTAGPDGEGADLRTEVLALLAREPLSGMEIMSTLAERGENPMIVPPAAMYPLLEELSAEGLTRLAMAKGAGSRQRPHELSPLGWEFLRGEVDLPTPAEEDEADAKETDEAAKASVIEVRTRDTPPWDSSGTEPATPLEEATERLWHAVDDTRRNGTETQADQARELVEECARELHELLVAEGVRSG